MYFWPFSDLRGLLIKPYHVGFMEENMKISRLVAFLVRFASVCTNWTKTVLLAEGDKSLWYGIFASFFWKLVALNSQTFQNLFFDDHQRRKSYDDPWYEPIS